MSAHCWIGTSQDTNKRPKWDEEYMDYLIYQLEKAPTTGKLHWQIYVEFKKQTRLDTVQSKLEIPRQHMEIAYYPDKCREYCRKEESAVEEDYYEFGTYGLHKQGKRNDLHEDKKILEETKDLTQVNFGNFCKYHKAYEKYLGLMMDKNQRKEKPKVILLWSSATGKRKSTKAKEMAGDNAYWKNNSKWWDGYKQQDIVVMDEFKMIKWEEEYIRQLWDFTPFIVEWKGGSCHFNSKIIIVTTNDDPSLYSENIQRRITEIINMN